MRLIKGTSRARFCILHNVWKPHDNTGLHWLLRWTIRDIFIHIFIHKKQPSSGLPYTGNLLIFLIKFHV